MPLTSTVLFGTPQAEVASLIERKLTTSRATSIVSGFITVEGMKALEPPIRANPAALQTVVVGAGTYRAYEAFDSLLASGVAGTSLFVHLGHSRLTTSAKARHRFFRYHPMLHSKVYYTEHEDGTASAIIGSHNVTAFALLGLNGEAAVLLEGPTADPQFDLIRQHIAQARSQSIQYAPGMKEAYSWWTTQFIEGLRDKSDDAPRDSDAKKTIVILAECKEPRVPKKDDVLYFELPSALGEIQSLRAEIHLYVFDTLPPSPFQALRQLHTARASRWCKTLGLELGQGGVELKANWQILNPKRPTLAPVKPPFRPTPGADMQQVRASVWNDVFGDIEYLFGAPRQRWIPTLKRDAIVQAPPDLRPVLQELTPITREGDQWALVAGLEAEDGGQKSKRQETLESMSPEAGAYILISTRRRDKQRGPEIEE